MAKSILVSVVFTIVLLSSTSSDDCKHGRQQRRCGYAMAVGVSLTEYENGLVLSNDLLSVTFTKPTGFVASIAYKGMANLLNDAGVAMPLGKQLNGQPPSSPTGFQSVNIQPPPPPRQRSPRSAPKWEVLNPGFDLLGLKEPSPDSLSNQPLSKAITAALSWQDPNNPPGFLVDAESLEAEAGYSARTDAPKGALQTVRVNGVNVVLDPTTLRGNAIDDRGYWDFTWTSPTDGLGAHYDRVASTSWSVTVRTTTLVEISFLRNYDKADPDMVPLTVDLRYALRAGDSALYKYAVLTHDPLVHPDVDVAEFRFVYKLKWDAFTFGATSGERKRFMPSNEDRSEARSTPLAFKEARNLTNPMNPSFRYESEHKYHYSSDSSEDIVHGFATAPSTGPSVGIWSITAAKTEWLGGGPDKQVLTIQAAPNLLETGHCSHYGTPAISLRSEKWAKVYGPFVTYLNSGVSTSRSQTALFSAASKLWEDAKKRAALEAKSWPYAFIQNAAYTAASQRATVSGRFVVSASTVNGKAWLGLASTCVRGEWQKDVKDYQFWVQVTLKKGVGAFSIKNVRAGTYCLHGWVPGVYGMFLHSEAIAVAPSQKRDLRTVTFTPIRSGPTLWEIGVPDRSAAEYFIPRMNPLCNFPFGQGGVNAYRNYGSWISIRNFYKSKDSVYTIGKSVPSKDWFYAHGGLCPLPEEIAQNATLKCVATTRRIDFNIPSTSNPVVGNYTLRISYAGSHFAYLVIQVNEPSLAVPWFFDQNRDGIGRTADNAMARAGIHGVYTEFSLTIPGSLLRPGNNSLYFTQRVTTNIFIYIMYDYIRLEGPQLQSANLASIIH